MRRFPSKSRAWNPHALAWSLCPPGLGPEGRGWPPRVARLGWWSPKPDRLRSHRLRGGGACTEPSQPVRRAHTAPLEHLDATTLHDGGPAPWGGAQALVAPGTCSTTWEVPPCGPAPTPEIREREKASRQVTGRVEDPIPSRKIGTRRPAGRLDILEQSRTRAFPSRPAGGRTARQAGKCA